MKLKIDKEEILYHIEELKKSRLFLAIVSLIIGLIVAFVLTPAFTEALKGKKEVVKIITDVKAGDRITEKMLTIVEVGGYNLDEEIATKKEEVVGQYAQMDIAKNTYVYKNYVSNISPLNNNYLKENLDGLKRAISFKVKSEAKPVAEKLQKNDIVTLIFTKVGSKNDTILDPYLKFVKVLALTTDTGRDFVAENVYKEDYEDGLIDTITVLANEDQAVRIAEMDEMAVIHCALVYREGQKNISNYLLEKQDEIINLDKYGSIEEPLEIKAENDEMVDIFSKNYTEDSELYFANKEQLMRYVTGLIKDDIKENRISTISELYREHYEYIASISNAKKRIATSSVATKSDIEVEKIDGEETKKKVKPKKEVKKEESTETTEAKAAEVETTTESVAPLIIPVVEEETKSNIIMPKVDVIMPSPYMEVAP